MTDEDYTLVLDILNHGAQLGDSVKTIVLLAGSGWLEAYHMTSLIGRVVLNRFGQGSTILPAALGQAVSEAMAG